MHARSPPARRPAWLEMKGASRRQPDVLLGLMIHRNRLAVLPVGKAAQVDRVDADTDRGHMAVHKGEEGNARVGTAEPRVKMTAVIMHVRDQGITGAGGALRGVVTSTAIIGPVPIACLTHMIGAD